MLTRRKVHPAFFNWSSSMVNIDQIEKMYVRRRPFYSPFHHALSVSHLSMLWFFLSNHWFILIHVTSFSRFIYWIICEITHIWTNIGGPFKVLQYKKFIYFYSLYWHLCSLGKSPEEKNCQGVSMYHFAVKTFIASFTSIIKTNLVKFLSRVKSLLPHGIVTIDVKVKFHWI